MMMADSSREEHKILCVGLTCVDIVSVCSSFPVEDSDQRCVEQRWQRGGNASNTATVISLLPNPCTAHYVGTLAASARELGFVEDELRRTGVDFSGCVYRDDCACPMSVVIVNQQNGSRTIVHSNKNLPELSAADLAGIDLDTTGFSWIHVEGRPNVSAAVEFLRRVDAHNACGKARIRTSVELEKVRPELAELLDKADVVFVSKEHAKSQGFKSKEEAVSKLVHRCRNGATLICPWGEEGAVAMTHTPGADHVIVASPACPPVKVVDTLAAGDTFVGACISALCCGRGVEEALAYGCRTAGAKCGMRGLDGLKDCERC